MDFQNFQFDAQPWMLELCSHLFKEDVFSSLCQLEFLYDYDYDFHNDFVVGFSILSFISLSMADFVCMNKFCEKYGCFYTVHSSENNCLSFHFFLETHE